MKYDLHSHSYYSDGELSPNQLIDLAIENDVTHLALTDHDTISGLEAASRAADQSALTLINGIELSCLWEQHLIHVVGLNISPTNDQLLAGIEQNTRRRFDRAEAMYDDFERHNIDLRDSVVAQIEGRGVPARPHFAQALIDQGYAKNKKQAFKRYLVKGKVGFIPMQWPTLEEVTAWIVGAGGIAVIAHPMRYKFTRTRLIRLIEDFKVAGGRALEVSTANTDKQQIDMLTRLAMQYDLLASIGSDFHAPDQSWARIGSAMPLAKELTPIWTQFNHA